MTTGYWILDSEGYRVMEDGRPKLCPEGTDCCPPGAGCPELGVECTTYGAGKRVAKCLNVDICGIKWCQCITYERYVDCHSLRAKVNDLSNSLFGRWEFRQQSAGVPCRYRPWSAPELADPDDVRGLSLDLYRQCGCTEGELVDPACSYYIANFGGGFTTFVTGNPFSGMTFEFELYFHDATTLRLRIYARHVDAVSGCMFIIFEGEATIPDNWIDGDGIPTSVITMNNLLDSCETYCSKEVAASPLGYSYGIAPFSPFTSPKRIGICNTTPFPTSLTSFIDRWDSGSLVIGTGGTVTIGSTEALADPCEAGTPCDDLGLEIPCNDPPCDPPPDPPDPPPIEPGPAPDPDDPNGPRYYQLYECDVGPTDLYVWLPATTNIRAVRRGCRFYAVLHPGSNTPPDGQVIPIEDALEGTAGQGCDLYENYRIEVNRCDDEEGDTLRRVEVDDLTGFLTGQPFSGSTPLTGNVFVADDGYCYECGASSSLTLSAAQIEATGEGPFDDCADAGCEEFCGTDCEHCPDSRTPEEIEVTLTGITVCAGCVPRENCATTSVPGSTTIESLSGVNGTHTLAQVSDCVWEKTIAGGVVNRRIFSDCACSAGEILQPSVTVVIRVTRVSGKWEIIVGIYVDPLGWGDLFTGEISTATCTTGGTANNENSACQLDDGDDPNSQAVHGTTGTVDLQPVGCSP